jgi:hypothetical protein
MQCKKKGRCKKMPVLLLMLHKKTAKPRNTVPHRAARLIPALEVNVPAAEPPWLGVLVPVAPILPKPFAAILDVREAVALAIEVVGMEVLPRYGDWAPQGWSALFTSELSHGAT